MFIKTIVTHEYPDLDAIATIWLLKRFGNDAFPGTKTAELEFRPAQDRYEGTEISDTIAVDIQGGHFDHHDQENSSKCSAVLVAEGLGLEKEPSLQKILRYVNMQDTTGKVSATMPDPSLLLFSLVEMIRGWHAIYMTEFVRTVEQVCHCLDAIYASERLWIQAQLDAKNAIVVQGNGYKVVGISSDSSSAMKAGRSLGANIVVVQSTNGHVGISATYKGEFSLDLSSAVARIRLAECYLGSLDYTSDQLFEVGDVLGWYFHPSHKIITRGSMKAKNVKKSLLTLEEICSLAAVALDADIRWPERLKCLNRDWEQVVTKSVESQPAGTKRPSGVLVG